MTPTRASRIDVQRVPWRAAGLVAAVWVALAAGLGSAPPVEAAGPPTWLLGRWQLDNELTHEAQPEGRERGSFSGLGRPTVTIGGLPVPGTGGGASAAGEPGPDPDVLRCAELEVATVGDELLFTFVGEGSEQLEAGNDQGRKTRWNRSRLTSSYETTSRKVTQIYEKRRDGALLVTVKLNPNQGPTVIEKRVFVRPPATPSPEPPPLP
jgi:hypothetical protein